MVCAIVLAIPLLLFGVGYYIHPPALPPEPVAAVQLLKLMREGGMTVAVTLSHIIAGVFLLVPRTRFVAAMLQLPMTIGIAAFHLTMWRAGLPVALLLLLLNLVVLWDPPRWRSLVE